MTKLLTQNDKIAKSSKGAYLVYNWGIPAYQSKTGLKTCPAAGQCAKGCYATQGAYAWSNVAQAYEYRLAVSQSDSFIQSMQLELDRAIKLAGKKGKQLAIRIHDSGDFYSVKYLKDWLFIIANNPGVKFYAYTKQVKLFRATQLPNNFTAIYSEGGIFDKSIEPNERHSRVFPDEASLIAAGYDNASKDDTVAFLSNSGKIGLIYHGAKSKTWTTNVTK